MSADRMMLDRFERAAMAYERLGKLSKDDAKTRAIRKETIAELHAARTAILSALAAPPPAERGVTEAVGDDLLRGDDGLYVFWPTSNKGAFTAANLRELADEMDRRNAPIIAELTAALQAGEAATAPRCYECDSELAGPYCPTCRPATAVGDAGVREASVERLFPKCDHWGAREWFDRLVNAVNSRDKAVRAGDDIAFETHNNIASSTASRLVHDYTDAIRSALSRSDAGGQDDAPAAPEPKGSE